MLEGVDLVVAITVSWIPLAADYTRFCRTRAGAFWGSGVGYLLATSGSGCSARSSSSRATSPTRRRCPWRSPPAASAPRSRCSRSRSTRPTRRSRTSTRRRSRSRTSRRGVPQRALLVAVATVATLGALTIDLLSYQTFLLLLGSFFVPLFGVLLADWLAAGRATPSSDVFGGPAVRPGMIGAWIAGFAAYQWLFPTGPQLVGRPRREARPAGLGDRRVAAELRRLARARARRRSARQAALLRHVGRRWAASR